MGAQKADQSTTRVDPTSTGTREAVPRSSHGRGISLVQGTQQGYAHGHHPNFHHYRSTNPRIIPTHPRLSPQASFQLFFKFSPQLSFRSFRLAWVQGSAQVQGIPRSQDASQDRGPCHSGTPRDSTCRCFTSPRHPTRPRYFACPRYFTQLSPLSFQLSAQAPFPLSLQCLSLELSPLPFHLSLLPPDKRRNLVDGGRFQSGRAHGVATVHLLSFALSWSCGRLTIDVFVGRGDVWCVVFKVFEQVLFCFFSDVPVFSGVPITCCVRLCLDCVCAKPLVNVRSIADSLETFVTHDLLTVCFCFCARGCWHRRFLSMSVWVCRMSGHFAVLPVCQCSLVSFWGTMKLRCSCRVRVFYICGCAYAFLFLSIMAVVVL